MSNITLTQKPIIEFSQLDKMAQEVDKRLSVYNFSQIVVDEENYKAIKSLRAELNKELKEFEEVRKQIKKALLEPYEEFEKAYKAKIADKYSTAEQSLKKLIDDVESGLKNQKLNELVEYFEELKIAKDIPFVTFERSFIKVGLSDSMKALREQVRSYVESIESDLELIQTQAHATRILVRYKDTLDVRSAISSVLREIEQEEALKVVPTDVVIKEPIQEIECPWGDPIIEEPEEILTVSFKVSGTKKQLIQLREYMKEEGIKYE